MDIACDHIQEETLSPEAPPDKGNEQKEGDPEKTRERATSNDLQTELSEAYKSFSQSSWGTALGGLWGDVRKRVSLDYIPVPHSYRRQDVRM